MTDATVVVVGATVVVVVGATVVVVVAAAGRATMMDCRESVIEVRVLPSVKPIENDDAASRVDVTAPSPIVAELVAAMVHTVDEV